MARPSLGRFVLRCGDAEALHLEFDSLAAGRLAHRHRHLVPRFEPATAERTADISSAYNYDVHVVPSFIDPGGDLRSAVSAMLDAFIWTLSGTCTDRRHHGRQRAVRDMQEERADEGGDQTNIGEWQSLTQLRHRLLCNFS